MKKRQNHVQKDIEKLFGVLVQKFAIPKYRLLETYVVIHNMTNIQWRA